MIQIVQRKLDAGPVLVALGAIVLFVSLWVDWFTPGGNGWETFETLDLVLAAIALTAPLIAFGRLAAGDGRLVTTLSAAAVVVIVVQLIQPPPIAQDADIETGAWLGLIGALAMMIGAALSLASFSVSVDVRGREARRVAAVDRREDAAPAAVDRREDAAPAAAGEQVAAAPPPDPAPTRPSGPAARRSPPAGSDDPERTQTMPALESDDPEPGAP